MTRHTDALAAFEQNDPLASLQAKISTFQKKQSKQATLKDDKYNWIQTRRKLKEKEEIITKQIIQASSSLLELMQNEMAEHEKENIDPTKPTSTCGAIKLIADVISSIQKSDHSDDDDLTTRILQLKQLSKDEIDTSLHETDKLCSALSQETTEHRRRVMLLLKEDQDGSSQIELPQSIASAFDSLRTLVGHDEDGGEIDMLENDMRRETEDAHNAYESTLHQINTQSKNETQLWDQSSRTVFNKVLASNSSTSNKLLVKRLSRDLPDKSQQEIKEYLDYHKQKKLNKQKVEAAKQDYKKKRQLIETNGLKEIARLRKEITARLKTMEFSIDNEYKQKELQLKLKSMRRNHEESEKEEAERIQKAIAKEEEDDYLIEAKRTQRLAKAKQSLRRYQIQQITEQDASSNGLNDNLQRIKQKEVNRTRISYRKEQMLSRQLKEQEKNVQQVREEEARLDRLNSLAASVPYYESIMDKAPDIHKTTKARENDFYRKPKLQDFQSGNLRSFTTDKVFSDSKFKLASALHEAGLSNTTYARDVVRAAIPRNEGPI